MRAFVTGSTGLLGSNLVRELCARGYQVRALVRSRQRGEQLLAGLPVELIEGDIEDVRGFADALAGCDAVFHTAAFFREYYGPGDHWAKLVAVNVEGSRALMRAAHGRGVRCAVDTSAGGIIGMKPSGEPGDETTPPSNLSNDNLYFRSKLLAEAALKEVSLETGLPIVFVLPGWMFGPGDAAPTGAGQLVMDFLSQRLPGTIAGGTSVVDVRDVAAGMIAALERGRARERYLVAGVYAELAEIFALLEKVSGVPAPRRHIPYWAGVPAAFVAERWARHRGKPTALSVSGLRVMHARQCLSSEKAARELGVRFRPLEATLRDTVQWFRSPQCARGAA